MAANPRKYIRGWQLGRSLEGDLTIVALKRAFVSGKPEVHHIDQGVQYAAKADTQLLENQGIAISMVEIEEPTQNGYAPAIDANDAKLRSGLAFWYASYSGEAISAQAPISKNRFSPSSTTSIAPGQHLSSGHSKANCWHPNSLT